MPIASFLMANRTAYFDDLNRYRDGHIVNLLTRLISAAHIASVEAAKTAEALGTLQPFWRRKLGTVRAGGSTSKMLDVLISNPEFAADELIGVIGRNPTSIYNAISILKDSEIQAPFSTRKRNQVWGDMNALLKLEDLDHRIAAKGIA